MEGLLSFPVPAVHRSSFNTRARLEEILVYMMVSRLAIVFRRPHCGLVYHAVGEIDLLDLINLYLRPSYHVLNCPGRLAALVVLETGFRPNAFACRIDSVHISPIVTMMDDSPSTQPLISPRN